MALGTQYTTAPRMVDFGLLPTDPDLLEAWRVFHKEWSKTKFTQPAIARAIGMEPEPFYHRMGGGKIPFPADDKKKGRTPARHFAHKAMVLAFVAATRPGVFSPALRREFMAKLTARQREFFTAAAVHGLMHKGEPLGERPCVFLDWPLSGYDGQPKVQTYIDTRPRPFEHFESYLVNLSTSMAIVFAHLMGTLKESDPEQHGRLQRGLSAIHMLKIFE